MLGGQHRVGPGYHGTVDSQGSVLAVEIQWEARVSDSQGSVLPAEIQWEARVSVGATEEGYPRQLHGVQGLLQP